jgi:hypothetical protein
LGQLRLPLSLAVRPSRSSPSSKPVRGAALCPASRRCEGLSRSRRLLPPPMRGRRRPPSFAASITRDRLGRGSPAHRARRHSSVAVVRRRQGIQARESASRPGTRRSAAAGTARALPGSVCRRRRGGEGKGRARGIRFCPSSPAGGRPRSERVVSLEVTITSVGNPNCHPSVSQSGCKFF